MAEVHGDQPTHQLLTGTLDEIVKVTSERVGRIVEVYEQRSLVTELRFGAPTQNQA